VNQQYALYQSYRTSSCWAIGVVKSLEHHTEGMPPLPYSVSCCSLSHTCASMQARPPDLASPHTSAISYARCNICEPFAARPTHWASIRVLLAHKSTTTRHARAQHHPAHSPAYAMQPLAPPLLTCCACKRRVGDRSLIACPIPQHTSVPNLHQWPPNSGSSNCTLFLTTHRLLYSPVGWW